MGNGENITLNWDQCKRKATTGNYEEQAKQIYYSVWWCKYHTEGSIGFEDLKELIYLRLSETNATSSYGSSYFALNVF